MSITNKIEEILKSYNVDYEKEYFDDDKTTEFRFEIGKRGMIVTYDKTTNEPNDYDCFMGGFENEMGVKSDSGFYRCMEDALLDISIKIKNHIKKYHYKGIQ